MSEDRFRIADAVYICRGQGYKKITLTCSGMVSKRKQKQLEFVYRLGLLRKRLSARSLSKKILIDNRSITERTIKQWFAELKEKNFRYYHSVAHERLGLISVFTLSNREPCSHQYCDNVWELKNPFDRSKAYLAQYLIPQKHFSFMKKYLLEKGIKELLVVNSSLTLSSPCHKTEKTKKSNESSEEFREEIALLRQHLKNIETKVPESYPLKKDLLLLPIIFESRKNHSSRDIWQSMRNTLGESVWKYVWKCKRQCDSLGIKRVQQEIKHLNTLSEEFVHQVVVEYQPIVKETLKVIFYVEYNNRDALLKLVKRCAKNSVRVTIHPSTEHAIVIANVETKGFQTLLTLESEGAEITKMFVVKKDLERHAFNYAQSFDPITRDWGPPDEHTLGQQSLAE